MSWYLTQHNDFIDGIQEFSKSSNITIINNNGGGGDSTDLGFNSTITDFLELKFENNVFNLYLKNTNTGGNIFLKNDNTNIKIKIENGKFYLYYDYNPVISLTITAGWTDIIDYIVQTRQGMNNNAGALVITGASIATLQQEITTIQGAVSINTALILDHDLRIVKLELFASVETEDLTYIQDNVARDSIIANLKSISNVFLDKLFSINNFTTLFAFLRTKTGLITSIGAVISFGGAVSAGLTLLGIIFDNATKETEREKINVLLNTLQALENNTDKDTVNKIYHIGLSIDETTNIGNLTDGVYTVNIQNGGEIQITVVGGFALITDTIAVADNSSIGDVININKNNIGGFGTLTVNVDIVYSLKEIIDLEIESSVNTIKEKENKQRRRQLIPNKNDFNDGFSITESTETQAGTGEELSSLSIALKLDTTQFEYDNSGNLQLINYSKFNEIQTNLGVASSSIPLVVATGLNLDVETLRAEVGNNITIPKTGIHKSIDDIYNLLGTIPDYDANGNVVDLASGIYARIDNIYKVVMEEGFTFDNNNDYKLSLGYDTVWNGFYYNLFCVALKTIRSGPFSSSFYGNDYIGLFPSLERVADKTTEYLLVKDTGIELLTNFHIKRGVLYFDNIIPTIDYDLARKFEFVTFFTPKNIDNLDVEYTILQTGVEISTNTYDIDNNKLKLSIINNKLNITNYIYYNTYYYQSLTTTLFNTYMLATFSSTGSFNLPSAIGFKEAVNTINGREHNIGIKSVQVSPTDVPTDQTWFNIVRSNGVTSSFYYWNFAILRDMTYQPQSWGSPVFYYKENLPLPSNRNNFSKITIRYDYEKFTTGSGWSGASFASQNAIDTGLEFKLQITRKQYDDPNNLFGSILVDFNQTSKVAGEIWYEMDIWIDGNSPIESLIKYNWVELELVHKGGSFTQLPSGTQSYDYYNSQHRIKIYTFGVYEYDTTVTNISDWKLHTFQDNVNDFFPTPIQQTTPHKAVFNLDLPNKIINYYVNNVGKALALQNEISIIGTSFANEDPNQTTHPATFVFANNTFTTLNQNNNILIIGNEPVSGELNYTHFNWNFIANGGSQDFMSLSQRNKLDELITYNYYYETVTVPRYLKTKELYADVFDARRLLINGGALYNDLSPAEQETRLRTSDQSTGNVLIGNSFLEIGKLFVDNPTISGNLTYDFNTKVFSISQGGSINTEDIENIIDGLIKTTPSTYGLIFNDTDVNDKYLQLDNTYINTLINLVLQNEVSFNTGFTNVNFNDILIQVKDASIYSPYNLRELVDVNTLYNYIVNGSHNYLIRELNQLVQYHPLLGPAFGDYLPTGSFNFNGILAEDQGNSSIDFEVVTTGAQITYGNGYDNNKLQNGLSGGLSFIKNINVFPFSDGYSGCISCFHKPYGATTGSGIFTVMDVNEVNLLRLRVGYTSGFAKYILDIYNQTNSDFTQYIFNNSENEIYYDNENSILIYYDFPNIYMYVNGFKHDGVITTYSSQTFQNARFKINTSTYNDTSLLYELKVYDRLLFKSNDDIFNFKRVAEITEFYRINPVSGSGLIIKELSGVQETKSRSITNKKTLSTLVTYTDVNVRNVLSVSGGNNINWNSSTNKFDCTLVPYKDSDVEVYLQNKGGTGITYNTNTQLFDSDITQYTNTNVEGYIKTKGGVNITYNPVSKKFDNDITQYEDSDVEIYLQGKAGVGMTYNTITQLFDCDIIEYTNTNLETALKLKGGNGMTYNVAQSRFDCDITQFTTADVRNILAVSDGEGIDWDPATNKFKLSGDIVTLANQYDETDVETLLATKGGINIYYNPATKKFDNSITGFDQLSGTITYATIFDPPNLANYITLGDIPVQYSTTILETELANKAGNLIDWNVGNNQFDVNIPTGTYVIPSEITNFITLGDIPVQYSTTILETELANKAGNLIDWNNTSKQFDVSLNNTYYDFTTPGKTILNQLVVIDNKALQFGQSTNPPKITILDGYITDVNIVEFTKTEYFTVRNRDGNYLLTIDNLYNTNLGGKLTLNNYGPDTGIQFADGSYQGTASLITDWDVIDINSLAYIRNKPTIPAQQVQSDFNQNNISSLAYIQNKPTLPSLLSNESGVILNLNGLTFTNTSAFIKEGAMSIVGSTYTSGQLTTIVEDFSLASGSINTTISGFNATFFTNGILGSQAGIPGGVGYNLGQISGLYNSYKSEVKFSGNGTGTSGTFNSNSIGYSKFFCFNGGTYRSLRTKNIQSIMSDIVSLSFYWIAGNNSNGGNRPESNENFELQFLDSFGNLMSNTIIHYGSVLYPNVANFTFYSMNLNASQQQSSYIRWFQLNTSSGPYDQYAFTGISFTFQSTESGGADIRFSNLPTDEPAVANKLWKDSNGFLKIS